MMDTGKISLRPVTDADNAVLLDIYASTRAQELATAPWNAEQKNAFDPLPPAIGSIHFSAWRNTV